MRKKNSKKNIKTQKNRSLKPLRKGKKVTVNLASKKFKTIPSSTDFEHATEIRLEYNSLQRIDELQKCVELRSLFMTCNYIESLEGLEKCVQLRVLIASSNNLSTLVEIRNLQKITHLELDHNRITSIRPLKYLVHLKKLNLSFNRITETNSISKLRLNELNIANNKISHCVVNTSHMQVLDISGNPLEAFPDLSTALQLNSLHVNSCRLSFLALPNLPALVELRASRNKLSKFEVSPKSVPNIESLDISQNNISNLRLLTSSLSNYREICTLYVYGNPLCQDVSYADDILEAVRQLRLVDKTMQNHPDTEHTIDEKALKTVEELGLDLNLDIETLERQFYEKMKEEKKRIIRDRKNQSRNKRKSSSSRRRRNVIKEEEDDDEEEEEEEGIDLKRLGSEMTAPSKLLLGRVNDEKRRIMVGDVRIPEITEEERRREEEELTEVTRLYEECRKASDNVQKQIDSIISDFGGSLEDFTKKLRERAEKTTVIDEEDGRSKLLEDGDVMTVKGGKSIRQLISQRPKTAKKEVPSKSEKSDVASSSSSKRRTKKQQQQQQQRSKISSQKKKDNMEDLEDAEKEKKQQPQPQGRRRRRRRRPKSSTTNILKPRRTMKGSGLTRIGKLRDIRRPFDSNNDNKSPKESDGSSNNNNERKITKKEKKVEEYEKVENEYTELKKMIEKTEEEYGFKRPQTSEKLFKKMNFPGRKRRVKRKKGKSLRTKRV